MKRILILSASSFRQPIVAILFFLCVSLCMAEARPVLGQMINTTTPFTTLGDSYYENFGLGFGFNLPGGRGNGSRIVGLTPSGGFTPNIQFRQNNNVIPPFGNFSPGGGGTIGFGRRSPGGGGFGLSLSLAKGNTRTAVTTAPSITTMNGASGAIFDGAFRPFVNSVVPIVGLPPNMKQVPSYENGVTRALKMGSLARTEATDDYSMRPERKLVSYGTPNSSATRGDLSVAAIKAQRAAAEQAKKQEIDALVLRASELSEAGEQLEARIELRKAVRLATDPQTKRRLESLIEVTRRR